MHTPAAGNRWFIEGSLVNWESLNIYWTVCKLLYFLSLMIYVFHHLLQTSSAPLLCHLIYDQADFHRKIYTSIRKAPVKGLDYMFHLGKAFSFPDTGSSSMG